MTTEKSSGPRPSPTVEGMARVILPVLQAGNAVELDDAHALLNELPLAVDIKWYPVMEYPGLVILWLTLLCRKWREKTPDKAAQAAGIAGAIMKRIKPGDDHA